MSVPLTQEKTSEAALVVFTLLVPASVGLATFSLIDNGLWPAIAAIGLATAGMIGSIAHLAKPLRAPTSLRGLRSSWLSREIAAVSLYWGCMALWLLGELAHDVTISLAGHVAAVLVAVALLTIIARAYKVSTRPAWCGNECLMELAACALGVGAAAEAMMASAAAVVAEATGTASAAGAAWGGVPLPLWALTVAMSVAGLALDIASHRSRRRRLENERATSDERIALTLLRYDELHGKIRCAWATETAAVVLAALGIWPFATIAQLIAHTLQRIVFYELPVQVRFVSPLRK